MKFLFETIAFKDKQPIYYRIYQVEGENYFAELVNEGLKTMEFLFGKSEDQWQVDDPENEDVCQQLGEEVDNFMRET